ncbi:hypothetical protein SAMN05428949_2087 [Chitinophaga sp. YR627]|uniref:hypothetical protein n=1 Tax=Chitinophaga sp. YR627 TaxID=1881041 RepID=UPI0008E569A7|nr:hypothetical protein [Chitinophaga sp. YR627]SFN24000.1 hypothetical protein SAMN05428949_2087 [Chitinophaga sp. YR627]
MDLAIIPECYIDTNLIETLVPPTSQYNHQKGCGKVTKVMKEKFPDSFALGIIDKDKQEVDYLKEFNILRQTDYLILHRHNKPAIHHYIIQINPAMERFILDGASIAGISLTDFGLPEELEAFKKTSKSVATKNDWRFKELFRSMYAAGVEDIVRLANWVRYLKENTYKAEADKLISI